MSAKCEMTWADVQNWLSTLTPAQLAAPAFITAALDDFDDVGSLIATELVAVASEHARISGAYKGPVMLVGPVDTYPIFLETQETGSFAEWAREHDP